MINLAGLRMSLRMGTREHDGTRVWLRNSLLVTHKHEFHNTQVSLCSSDSMPVFRFAHV